MLIPVEPLIVSSNGNCTPSGGIRELFTLIDIAELRVKVDISKNRRRLLLQEASVTEYTIGQSTGFRGDTFI